MSRTRPAFPVHPGARRDCPECKGQSYVVRREGELAVASLCGCVGSCPLCRDTGFVAVGTGFRPPRVRCRCHKAGVRIALFNRARIPGIHAQSTRESFHVGPSRHLAGAFMQIGRWMQDFQPGADNRGVVLHGPVGTGKTHLLVAVLRELVLDYGVSARFVEFSHLVADLKSSFDRREGSASLIDPLVKVEVLAIDELGKGRNTEWEGTVLDELVSRRYNAAGTILGTTNHPPQATGATRNDLAASRTGLPQDMPNQAVQGLPDRVGDRVFSRLSAMCDFVPVLGDDWRRRDRSRRMQ